MIVIDGKQEQVPGVASVSWLEDQRFRLAPEDSRTRGTHWVRSLFLHSTQGMFPQRIIPGVGPSRAAKTVDWWRTGLRPDGKPVQSAAHLIVDSDAVTYCLADLVQRAAFHAGTVNEVSIGIEITQEPDGDIYQAAIDATVLLVDYLTLRLGIQRQFHGPYRAHPIERLSAGGQNCIGVFGHRDQTEERGRGDPGDVIFAALQAAGYERFDFGAGNDLTEWRDRQGSLQRFGHPEVQADGVPGPITVAALRKMGHPGGLWVTRPVDTGA